MYLAIVEPWSFRTRRGLSTDSKLSYFVSGHKTRFNMKSMLIFYLVYEFLELMHVTRVIILTFIPTARLLASLPFPVARFLPLLPLYSRHPSRNWAVLALQGLPCPQTTG